MIIIQCHAFVKEEERQLLYRDLVKQSEKGIILLPACCRLVTVTQGDTEIEIMKEG